MNIKKNVALVFCGLLIGCGAGAVATQRVSAQTFPAAPTQPTGPRWQQFCEQAGSLDQANSVAGARGAEGFELVALYNGVMCFKRPIPAGAPRPAPAGAPGSWPGY